MSLSTALTYLGLGAS